MAQASSGGLSIDSQSAEDEKNTSLSRDDVFHILRNQRRRYVIHYLKQQDRPANTSSIATQVAAWENGISPEALTSEERRRVYNALHQTHIPTLNSAGVIRVDRNEIELTERAKEIEFYLEFVPKDDIPWAIYFVTLSGIQVVSLALAWTGLGPLNSVPMVSLPTFFAAAFLFSSVVYYRDQSLSRIGSEGAPPEVDSL